MITMPTPSENSSTIWLPDITDWSGQQEETQIQCADPSNVACNIFSIVLNGVEVEASFTLGQDIIGWRQYTSTG
jgi:hypothetical protein